MVFAGDRPYKIITLCNYHHEAIADTVRYSEVRLVIES